MYSGYIYLCKMHCHLSQVTNSLSEFHTLNASNFYSVFVIDFLLFIQNGSTALFHASQKGHLGVVNALLAAGCNVNLCKEVRHCIQTFKNTRNTSMLFSGCTGCVYKIGFHVRSCLLMYMCKYTLQTNK